MKSLILGAMAGAFAALYWHDDLMRVRDKAGADSSSSLRDRAADMVDSVEASVGGRLRSWSRTLRGGTDGHASTAVRTQSIN